MFLRNIGDGTCLDRLGQSISLYGTACNAEIATQRAELLPGGTGVVKLRFQDRFAQLLWCLRPRSRAAGAWPTRASPR